MSTTAEHSPSPLDALPSLEELQVEAERVRRCGAYKRELLKLLGRVQNCCLPNGKRMNWLREEEYKRIHFLVTELSIFIRKKPLGKPWSGYTAVDHHWPGLRLCSSITGLIERAVAHMPMRPLEVFAATIQRESLGRPLAAKAMKCLESIRLEGRAPAKTDWQQFGPLLLLYRNEMASQKGGTIKTLLELREREAFGNEIITAYAVFLEICCEDRAWCRQHFRGYWDLDLWVKTVLRNVSLIRLLTRMFRSREDLASAQEIFENAPLQAKREAERKRQAKHRQRIPRKKRDAI